MGPIGPKETPIPSCKDRPRSTSGSMLYWRLRGRRPRPLLTGTSDDGIVRLTLSPRDNAKMHPQRSRYLLTSLSV